MFEKLYNLSTKKFLAFFSSIIIILLLLLTVSIAMLIESAYVLNVSNKIYRYSSVDYKLEKNTTYIIPLKIINGELIREEITTTRKTYLTYLDKDWTKFIVKISINIAIREGSIVVDALMLMHEATLEKKVYIDQTISKINTTIDEWNFQTTSFFSIHFKTSDIAKTLDGVYIPFWLS